MENLNYRLDRTTFQGMTFEEADKQINDSKNLSFEERIKRFNYLMSIAYPFVGNNGVVWTEVILRKSNAINAESL